MLESSRLSKVSAAKEAASSTRKTQDTCRHLRANRAKNVSALHRCIYARKVRLLRTCRLVLHARRLVARALARDEARREAAVREPRRELARVVGTEHPVASLEVRLEAVLVPKVVLEPAERHGLAAVKGHHSSRIGGDGKGVRVVAKR
eukprot:5850742-Pleurochrysis_carterae.AAC.1